MRTLGWLVLAVLVAAACDGERAAAPAGDGALVLEVGGGQPSLRQALKRAGLDVPPPIELSPAAAAPPPPAEAGGAKVAPPARPPAADGPAKPSAQKPPAPAPAPAAEASFTTVTLAEGQTLIHLARKHLGDGNRFRELLELNGWSEAESRRLKPGTKVKVPKSAAARSGGR